MASGVFCWAALAKDVGADAKAANPPPLLLLPNALVVTGLAGVVVPLPNEELPKAD